MQSATGKIRNYQIVVGGIYLLNLPISYLLLYLGSPPESTLIVAIVVSQMCLAARLCFLRNSVQLPICKFIKDVYFKAILVTILSAFPSLICYWFIQPSYQRLLIICGISFTTSLFCIFYIGCDIEERKTIIKNLHKIKKKVLKR